MMKYRKTTKKCKWKYTEIVFLVWFTTKFGPASKMGLVFFVVAFYWRGGGQEEGYQFFSGTVKWLRGRC